MNGPTWVYVMLIILGVTLLVCSFAIFALTQQLNQLRKTLEEMKVTWRG